MGGSVAPGASQGTRHRIVYSSSFKKLGAGLLTLGLVACAGYPWNEENAQLPLGGDRECSGPALQVAEQCCFAHDNAYWNGGTEQDRAIADAELLLCMLHWGVPEWVANNRYMALRAFGHSSWRYTAKRSRRPPLPASSLPTPDDQHRR